MAKTLAIKVKFESTGEEKVIKNIDELEGAIEDLNNELKTLDFGSEEYEAAAKELAKLRGEFRDIEKDLEGLDTEQRLTALAGATELIAGSFLIASSAARTFGASVESIEEIEKLEQQALEAVNIALGIRAVAEGLVQAAQLKRLAVETATNVQTKIATGLQTAYAAVVGTSTGALKAFRIALAATGIGLAVIAIAALIENWDKLTGAIDRSNEKADDFRKINAEAEKSIAKTRVELEFYAGIVNDVTKSEQERNQALEELNKLGVITEDITLDQADALDILNERLELQRENILLVAQAQAAANLLSEAFEAQIEAQNSTYEDNITFFDQLINSFTSLGNSTQFYIQNAVDAYENQQEAIEGATEDVERYESIYLEILTKLNENESKLTKERDKSDKKTKESNKTKEKTIDIDEQLNKLSTERAELLKKVRRETELLATEERDEVKVIEDANKILEEQNKLLEERLGILGTTQGEAADFYDELDRLLGGIQVPEEIKELEDTFNTVFELVKVEGQVLTGLFNTANSAAIEYLKSVQDGYEGTFEEFEKTYVQLEDLTEEQVAFNRLLRQLEKIDIEILNEEQRQILIDFYDTQVRINDAVDEYNVKINETTDEKNKELQILQGQLVEELSLGKITFEKYQTELKKLEAQRKQNEEIRKLVANETNYNKLLEDIVELQNTSVERGVSTAALQEEINDLVANQLFDVESVNDLQEDQLEIVDKVSKSLVEQSKTYQQIEDINKELEKLNVKILEGIEKQTEELSDAQFEALKQFVVANEDKLDTLKDFFETASVETTNLTQQQIDEINRLLDSIETKNLQESLAATATQIVGIVNDVTGQIQGIISDSISLQLESLDYYGEQTLAEIGDETEKQRALQEEVRLDLERKKFELNRRARLTDLNFSLATTTASGAQAAITAIATVPPPGGQILAGIYGGITLAQLAVIRDQIQFVKNQDFQVARRGGLVMGNSHEYGGVIARNGLELEGGEAILNRNAVAEFGDLLSQINVSTGGRALSRNDSEITQEIRQQNQRPIKTYVLYEDIQNTNKINSKLEQISRL